MTQITPPRFAAGSTVAARVVGGLALAAALLSSGPAQALCPAADVIQSELTCSSTVTGRVATTDASALGGSTIGTFYTCGTPYAPLAQTNPEDVYSFTCQNNGVVDMAISGLNCDLDIYILDDSCSPFYGCEAGTTNASVTTDRVTFTCTAGQTYYVVVEGYGYTGGGASGHCGAGEGAYTLGFDVSAGTGCSEDCDDGLDNDLDGAIDCADSDCADDPVCDFDLDNDGYDAVAYGGTDCNDSNAAVNPGATEYCNGIDDDCDGSIDESTAADAYIWYRDADSDSYGNPSASIAACTNPAGYVSDRTDCDDTRATTHPGAAEVCDSRDNDCDGSVDEGLGTTWYRDADSDGYGTSSTTATACSAPSGYVSDATDCNDAASTVHPGAPEVCNSVDDDCDGSVDEGVGSTYYRDADGDGYGNVGVPVVSCTTPSGYVANATDCNDSVSSVHPGAAEVCNGVDDDCDGSVDEAGGTTWYADTDGDGFGNLAVTSTACSAPAGYVSNSTDCDDTRSGVNPSATEVCDGLDNDCDGSVDETGGTVWYADTDSDGYGTSTSTRVGCAQPIGYVAVSGDCDDTRSSVNPGAAEVCDGLDNDCNGSVDEAGGAVWYADADSDGYGNASVATTACTAPVGYIADATDCNDAVVTIHPGADEYCNGLDDDCDGLVDDDAIDASLWYEDADADAYGNPEATSAACIGPDGYVTNDDDCWDDDATVHPGAIETADGVDENCDGTVDEATDVYDDDGDGYAEVGGDCDDGHAEVSPAALEECDSRDEDCDGVVDNGTECVDDDGDGFAETDSDCNDGDAAVSPGSPELPDNGVDDNCDGAVDGGAYDPDGDGYSETGGDCLGTDGTVYPGAPETENGVDDDCDGVIDEGTAAYDDDGDGLSEAEDDCNDGDATVSPDSAEASDGVDNDCDGVIDEGTDVTDDDGDGYSEQGGDCDDANDAVNPATPETGNGTDDDCDGTIDEGIADADGDGFAVADGDCNDNDGWSHPDADEACDGEDNDCDGVVDNGCASDTGDKVQEHTCGCGVTGAAAGVAPLLLILGATVLRRRRSA